MPQTLSDETKALLALHLVEGLSSRSTSALLDQFGTARAVLEAGPSDWAQIPYVNGSVVEKIQAIQTGNALTDEVRLLDELGVELLLRGQSGYPAGLVELAGTPAVLYMRGNYSEVDDKAVALVGSRRCTGYGRRLAEQFATGLVRAGYTVVSGLARGIDGIAHRAALEAGGRTIAVLAGGLSKIYPPEHDALARDVEKAGALLTEAPLKRPPLPNLFPARNRLISGLSRAVVVIEAAAKSGALITASHAAEQGRTVLACPGPVDSEASAGCNNLIRDGAILARSVDDILEELEGIKAAVPERPKSVPAPKLDGLEKQLWDLLQEKPRHIDDLTQGLEVPLPKVAGALMLMEMHKHVRRLPGNMYERV